MIQSKLLMQTIGSLFLDHFPEFSISLMKNFNQQWSVLHSYWSSIKVAVAETCLWFYVKGSRGKPCFDWRCIEGKLPVDVKMTDNEVLTATEFLLPFHLNCPFYWFEPLLAFINHFFSSSCSRCFLNCRVSGRKGLPIHICKYWLNVHYIQFIERV